MRLRLSPCVPTYLAEITEYIAKDSPKQAAVVVRMLRATVREVAKQPLLYRLRPEIGVDARLVPVGEYVILFRILNDIVRI